MKTIKIVEFDWDRGNRDKNYQKHKVSFKEAEDVFFNRPLKVFKDKKHSQVEERFIALGKSDSGRKLFITFTIRRNKLRVISARDQSRKERKIYEKKQTYS